jgi:hypothetical protein
MAAPEPDKPLGEQKNRCRRVTSSENNEVHKHRAHLVHKTRMSKPFSGDLLPHINACSVSLMSLNRYRRCGVPQS